MRGSERVSEQAAEKGSGPLSLVTLFEGERPRHAEGAEEDCAGGSSSRRGRDLEENDGGGGDDVIC